MTDIQNRSRMDGDDVFFNYDDADDVQGNWTEKRMDLQMDTDRQRQDHHSICDQ